jgi:imidazolonepropionase-like amidohydrolase
MPPFELPSVSDARVRDVLIRDARVFTGTEIMDRASVLLQDGRIRDLVAGTVEARDGAAVVDGTGTTVLPGLIDCHVHLKGLHHSSSGSRDFGPGRVVSDTVAVLDRLPALAREGIAVVRDCGYPHAGIFAIRAAADRPDGPRPWPRLMLSGQGLCASGGHGAASAIEVDGTDEVRRAVRLLAKSGADWVKLMMTGGTATPGELVSDVQFTVDEASAAVDEAHRRSRRVSAHCSNLPGTIAALDAGVDSIEHGIDLDGATVRRMADSGTWLSPALRCTEVEGIAEPDSGIPDYIRSKGAEIYRRQMESFQRACAANVRVVVSTDAQQSYLPLGIQTLVEEMQVMARLGMPVQAVLQAATSSAAEMLGIGQDHGRIRAGARADLLIVEGDPLADLSTLTRPKMVFLGGRLLPGQPTAA